VVPIFREDGWQLGEVQEPDGDQHIVVFPDNTRETVVITLTPFSDYLRHWLKEPTVTNTDRYDDFLSWDFWENPLDQLKDPLFPPSSPVMEESPRVEAMHGQYEPHPADWVLDRVLLSCKLSPLRPPSPFVPEDFDDFQALAAATPPRGTPTREMSARSTSTPARRTTAWPTPRRTAPVGSTPKRKRQDTSRKALPKAWTTNEDRLLIQLVQEGAQPTKWSDVALSVGDRTGKQCRERYLNHLTPKLRVEEWSAQEDVTLCKLYQLMGSRWAVMAKIIKGRTDNNIKNRFHHIRRRLEKEVSKIVKNRKIEEVASLISIDAIRRSPLRSETNSDFAIRARQIIPYLAADTVKNNIDHAQFGPFVTGQGEFCMRCSFVVPSVQTGKLLAKKTGWCESCTKVPPYVVGDTLRQCLQLRRDKSL
jgi:Myb-like DNA-binding domain